MSITLGPYQLPNRTLLAPMAGVTDRPFRQLCRQLGAGLVISEMISSNPTLRNSKKTQQRMDHSGEPGPIAVQIAGGDATMMADAARFNVDHGAEIIDINMGCPAKKVCQKAAGSALLKDEALVKDILHAVVAAVSVPVTLKIRTGWDKASNNALKIATIAEDAGIRMLSIHGRSRACHYKGQAEYDTVARVKSQVQIPIVVNGDITTPEQAAWVLEQTQADAVMIGRAAQGKPWIFSEFNAFLDEGVLLPAKPIDEVRALLQAHLQELYGFYGEFMGLRIARKHVAWYCQHHHHDKQFRQRFNALESATEQLALLEEAF